MMIQVNLLPWRQRAREVKKKRFILEAGLFLLGTLFILMSFHLYYSHQVNMKQELLDYLQTEIEQEQDALNNMSSAGNEEATIRTQLYMMMNIYLENNHSIGLLNALITLVPDNVAITTIVKESNVITLSGVASTEDDVNHFMQAISKISYFKQPVLTDINQDKNNGNRYFELRVEQKG